LIILQLRTFTYGLTTDIKKAFFHVDLDKGDRDLTRFFWLSNPEEPESKFQVYHHLDSYNTTVAEDMKGNIYVNNVISGCNQDLETVAYYKEAHSIMNEAHFNLRSWSSNSSSLREEAAKDGTSDSNEIVIILGLKWNPFLDILTLTASTDSPHSSWLPSEMYYKYRRSAINL